MGIQKKLIKQTIYIAATAVVILLIIKYISANWVEFQKIEITQPVYAVALILFSALNLLAYGKGLDVILRPFNVHLSLYETIKIASLTRLLNQVIPGKAGVAARAHYLKKFHNLQYTHYTSSFLASNMLMHCMNSAIGLVALLFLPTDGGVLSLGLILGGVLIFFMAIFAFKPEIKDVDHHKRIVRYLKKTIDGWSQIRRHNQTLKSTILWMFVYVLSQTLIFMASFTMLGVDISFWGAAFVGAVTLLSSFISFTPGALGIAEALTVASSVALGIGAPVAFAAAILRRLAGVLMFLIGALVTLPSAKNNTQIQK